MYQCIINNQNSNFKKCPSASSISRICLLSSLTLYCMSFLFSSTYLVTLLLPLVATHAIQSCYISCLQDIVCKSYRGILVCMGEWNVFAAVVLVCLLFPLCVCWKSWERKKLRVLRFVSRINLCLNHTVAASVAFHVLLSLDLILTIPASFHSWATSG